MPMEKSDAEAPRFGFRQSRWIARDDDDRPVPSTQRAIAASNGRSGPLGSAPARRDLRPICLRIADVAANVCIRDDRRAAVHPERAVELELERLANRDQGVAVFVAGKICVPRGWPADWEDWALMQHVKKHVHDAVSKTPIRRIHSHSTEHPFRAESWT